MTGAERFIFLNVERTLASARDWNNPAWPKLWLYNAHYFDDLCASNASARVGWHRGLASRWITENPPCQGGGWEPYPTSLRIVNWVKWLLAGNPPIQAMAQSLAVQTRMLRNRLEIHLLGNHLWANAKALVFAGAVFEGPESAAWLEKGLIILRRELSEQVLKDGGHFERSPMYHAIVIEDLLDLVQLSIVYPKLFDKNDSRIWKDTVSRMLPWSRVMSHPDGGISFFNDAAFGVAPTYSSLCAYAAGVGVALGDSAASEFEVLADSGYVRLQLGGTVLIADVGRIGPDYLPGHAHADTLSFELSIDGERVIVNGGTSTYEVGAARALQRGTSMHNTVEVNGADSSEVWSSFRVARRARPFDVRWGREGDTLWLEAAHDGYQRLPGCVTHRRRWDLGAGRLRITDTLEGRVASAVAAFRFAPVHEPYATAKNAGEIKLAGRRLWWECRGAAEMDVASSTWHPRFGVSEACKVARVTFGGAQLQTEFHWAE